jgi:four helix bundle protein
LGKGSRVKFGNLQSYGNFPPTGTVWPQLRRAAVSIPANIAEGCGRSGEPELARFLRIALGLASELEYHIILSTDLCYLNKSVSQQLFKQVTEVKRMLTSLIQKLTAES